MDAIKILCENEEMSRFGLSFVRKDSTIFDRMIDSIVAQEMLLIQNKAELNNIPILFFKGLTEKKDTYEIYPINRIQHDVDILINVKDVYRFCKICSEVGYHTDYDEEMITESWISSSLDQINCHHLPVIHKNYLGDSSSKNAILISLEVHIVIDSAWRIDKLNVMHSREMISRRVISNPQFPIYTLDVYDRLIVSMHHFSKHFLSDFFVYPTCLNNQMFQCKTLLDALLIIKKYGDVIDYTTFINRVREYNFLEYVRFAAKMIIQLFEMNQLESALLVRISDEPYENKQIASKKNFASQTLFNATKSLNDVLNKSDLEFYKETIYNCLCDNKKILVNYGKKTALPLEMTTIFSKSTTEAKLCWNSDAIEFSISMDTPLGIECDALGRHDGISIRIYNPEFDLCNNNAIRNIFVCFEQSSGHIVPSISFNGGDSFKKGSIELPSAYVKFEHNLCAFTISIPWEELSINIHNNSHIGLEFMVYHNFENTGSQVCYLSNCSWPHHNPAKFGMIRLIKE